MDAGLPQANIVLEFDRGTLLLSSVGGRPAVDPTRGDWTWDERVSAWRCDAICYPQIHQYLAERFGQGFKDDAPKPVRVSWPKVSLPELRPEQLEALSAWMKAGYRGQVIMPTGTGKTEVALSAIIQTPWKTKARLELSDCDGFKSHLPPPEEFDSTVEEAFAAKFGPERDGWQLIREGEVLHQGQSAFVPDFVFKHEDGTRVLMEIVGFWTPEYLADKRQTLRQFHQHRILIALPERSVREDATVGDNVILYKTALKLQPVLEALERCRTNVASRPQESTEN
jgi:hypothetical protein